MRRLTTLMFALSCLVGLAGPTPNPIEARLKFWSGPDTACSLNCLHVSANGGRFLPIGCNKRALGECRSPGGIRGEIPFLAYTDRCNRLELKLMTQGKDGGPAHESLRSTQPGLVPNRHYRVNFRSDSSLGFWLNDNSDFDYHDFQAVLSAPFGVRIGIEGFPGAACE